MGVKYVVALESIPIQKLIFSSNEQFKYNKIKCSKTFCKWYNNYTEKISSIEKLNQIWVEVKVWMEEINHNFEWYVVSFGFDTLCKTTWYLLVIFMNKGHMWKQMYQHVWNIYPLSPCQYCSCSACYFLVFSNQIFGRFMANLFLYFSNAFV